MKVIREGFKHMAYKCDAKCAWCGSSLKFFIDKGDKRVSRYRSDFSCIRFICPVCGERNTNISSSDCKGLTEINIDRVPITTKEYEEEIVPLATEQVELSDEDIYWLKGGESNRYIYCKEEES